MQKALVARNEQLQRLVEQSGQRATPPDGRPRTAPLVRSFAGKGFAGAEVDEKGFGSSWRRR